MRIIDLLVNSAQRCEDKIAVKSGPLQISYGQILSDSYAIAKKLEQAGCREGIKVAIILNNSAEYLAAFFAVSCAGGIIMPLSIKMTPHEVARHIYRADVSILITNNVCSRRLSTEMNISCGPTVLSIQYSQEGKLEIEITTTQGECKDDDANYDVALMIPTSGTTGPPKIALLTDHQLISNMTIYRTIMGFDDHNVVYCALPQHHIYPICAQILTHISLADTFVIDNTPFLIKDFITTIQQEAVTITAFVPSMAILLAEFRQDKISDITSLKNVTISGAKTPVKVIEILERKYSHIRFVNTYGMTEAGSRISIAAPFNRSYPRASVGVPMPTVSVRITDGRGNHLPENKLGEIEVNSSGVMKGYYKQPELTVETLKDGWLKTGDLGRIDDSGNLFLSGRLKDIIISGGENIYPADIEECLMEHPAIREAAVIGQKDRLLQEVPKAFIVHRGHTAKSTPTEIMRFCRARLSSHKVPRSVEYLEKIPRLSSSKIDKKALERIAVNSSQITHG